MKDIKVREDNFLFNNRGVNKFRIQSTRFIYNSGYIQGTIHNVQQLVNPPKWMFWKKPKFKNIKFVRHSICIDAYRNIINGDGECVGGYPINGFFINIDNVDHYNNMIKSGEISRCEIRNHSFKERELKSENYNEAEKMLGGVENKYKSIYREERLKRILEK